MVKNMAEEGVVGEKDDGDEENEEEWEEEYVYVDLVGMVDPDKLSQCTKENTSILVSILKITIVY